jgi:hypothetical protein
MFSNQNLPKICPKYFCEKCDYYTSKKSSYGDHLLTAKHKLAMIGNQKSAISCSKFMCPNCSKIYKDNSGLWRHKKKCFPEQNVPTILEQTIAAAVTSQQPACQQPSAITTDVVLQILKQNEDLQKLLIEQTTKLMELAKEGKQIINSNNTNNTTNNFNLNLFLNEKCKDAINITDFVNSLVVTINDLEETARIGYAEGISKIFVNGLRQLDVYKRPIHCSDLKREVLYIKDQDNWSKDDDKTHLLQAIKNVGNKNIRQISEWQKMNPQFNNPESKQNDQYLSMLCNVMSGGSKEESLKNYEKIVKNISKVVVIDK